MNEDRFIKDIFYYAFSYNFVNSNNKLGYAKLYMTFAT